MDICRICLNNAYGQTYPLEEYTEKLKWVMPDLPYSYIKTTSNVYTKYEVHSVLYGGKAHSRICITCATAVVMAYQLQVTYMKTEQRIAQFVRRTKPSKVLLNVLLKYEETDHEPTILGSDTLSGIHRMNHSVYSIVNADGSASEVPGKKRKIRACPSKLSPKDPTPQEVPSGPKFIIKPVNPSAFGNESVVVSEQQLQDILAGKAVLPEKMCTVKGRPWQQINVTESKAGENKLVTKADTNSIPSSTFSDEILVVSEKELQDILSGKAVLSDNIFNAKENPLQQFHVTDSNIRKTVENKLVTKADRNCPIRISGVYGMVANENLDNLGQNLSKIENNNEENSSINISGVYGGVSNDIDNVVIPETTDDKKLTQYTEDIEEQIETFPISSVSIDAVVATDDSVMDTDDPLNIDASSKSLTSEIDEVIDLLNPDVDDEPIDVPEYVHIKLVNKRIAPGNVMESSKIPSKQLLINKRCNFCNRQFEFDVITEHIKSHVKSATCPMCKQVFNNYLELNRHMPEHSLVYSTQRPNKSAASISQHENGSESK